MQTTNKKLLLLDQNSSVEKFGKNKQSAGWRGKACRPDIQMSLLKTHQPHLKPGMEPMCFKSLNVINYKNIYLSRQHCRLSICLSESEANPNNNPISTFEFPAIYIGAERGQLDSCQSISVFRNLENCNPPNFCIFPKKSSTVTLLPIW